MESNKNKPLKLNSISEMHKVLGFPKPVHPLVSLVNYTDIKTPHEQWPKSILPNFYKISFNYSLTGKVRYGQNYYDFDEGCLSFISPNQVVSCAAGDQDFSGYTLLLHPDYIKNQPLLSKIKTYGFFSYSANEALFLSEREKELIFSIFENIKKELENNIDDYSQEVIVSLIEVLLNYSNRFYKRQFITRKTVNHSLLIKLDEVLNDYFNNISIKEGLPSVEFIANKLNISPRYLSDMLRNLTGLNAQQHIHEKMIEKAKEYLTVSNLTVSEVAYQLGFEQPQSFNKLFKKKTKITPLEFKLSIN